MKAFNKKMQNQMIDVTAGHIIELLINVYTQRLKFVKRTMPGYEAEENNTHILPRLEAVIDKASACFQKYDIYNIQVLEEICRDAWQLYSPFLPVFNSHEYISLNDNTEIKANPVLVFSLVVEILDKLRMLILNGGEISMRCKNHQEEQSIEFSVKSSFLDYSKIRDIRNIFRHGPDSKSTCFLINYMKELKLKASCREKRLTRINGLEQELLIEVFFL
ncbi:MAG: hypothetical protein ACYTFY_20935 [Planctomycetota bacterium]|jgi:hypothetical protein